MLAGGRIDTLCQRTHLTSPDAHTTEMVSAGSMLARVLPVRGQLLELSIYQHLHTPVYIDSASAIFVIEDKRAAKRSIWLLRRAAILQEAQQMRDIIVIKISESDQFSDPETKVVAAKTYRKHLWYTNNLQQPMPA